MKVHSAVLPSPSTKMYVTEVDPTTKNCPGARVLDWRVTMPELSVAVGSVNWTMVPPMLRPTVAPKSSQLEMTGGISSTGM